MNNASHFHKDSGEFCIFVYDGYQVGIDNGFILGY